MRITLVIVSSIMLGACSMFGYNTGVKEPPFSALKTDGAYELREYPHIVMVTSYAKGNFENAQDESFNKLFDYISGKNASKTKIPMTAPVFVEPKGEKIPMTAPVIMSETDKGWAMSFVLPEDATLETAPLPLDPSLKLEERKNLKFAVVKFNGLFSERNFEEYTKALNTWIEKNGLKPTGAAMRAGYNPPWTLPPLRRNEILIPVE